MNKNMLLENCYIPNLLYVIILCLNMCANIDGVIPSSMFLVHELYAEWDKVFWLCRNHFVCSTINDTNELMAQRLSFKCGLFFFEKTTMILDQHLEYFLILS